MNLIRTAVSGKRNRRREGEFDLDLTYITPRVIAMAYPSEGVESMYRNDIRDVAKFLNMKHGDSYMVFNLSERHYDISLFGNRVVELGFPDHYSPPVEVAWTLCQTMHAWLNANPAHVVVVHCLAGKGRTGVIIACYLLYCGFFFPPKPRVTLKDLRAPGTTALHAAVADSGPNPFGAPAAAAFTPTKALALASASAATAAAASTDSDSGAAALPADTTSLRSASKRDAGLDALAHARAGGGNLFALLPPRELATRALHLFRHQRGEGVKYPSQERTVRYFARVVHDAIITQHALLERIDSEAGEAIAAAASGGAAKGGAGGGTSNSGSRRSSTGSADESGAAQYPTIAPMPSLDLAAQADSQTKAVQVRWEAAEALRTIKSLPLPRNVPVIVSKIIVSGLPPSPGNMPVLHITSAPYQGAATKVIYNSSWHPASTQIYPGPGGGTECLAIYSLSAAFKGDVLFLMRAGSTGQEMLRFAFHSSFMIHEGVRGVYRLRREDVDAEKKVKTAFPLPAEFFIDIIYDTVDMSGDVPTAADGAAEAAATDAADSTESTAAATATAAASAATASDEQRGGVSPTASTPAVAHRRASTRASIDFAAAASAAAELAALSLASGRNSPAPQQPRTPDAATASNVINGSNSGGRSSRGRSFASQLEGSSGGSGAVTAAAAPSAATVIPLPDVPIHSALGFDALVKHSGWLVKRGTLMKSWKKRWFVLRASAIPGIAVAEDEEDGGTTPSASASSAASSAVDGDEATALSTPTLAAGGCLYYFSSPSHSTPKGVIPLTAASVARVVAANSKKTGGRDHVFAIIRDSRKHYLQGTDEEDVQKWIAAIASL